MTIKSALSVAALTIALTGAAFAQGMTINGVAVSESDLPAVQERCAQLAEAEGGSLSPTTGDDATADASGDSATESTDATTDEAPAVNEAQAATTTIDLETIDLQACTDGGFVTQ